MKWTKIVRKRYESIIIGGTLFGILLGIVCAIIVFKICSSYQWGNLYLLSFCVGLSVAVIVGILNWNLAAGRLMIVEAVEALHEINSKLKKQK
ncbi:MAG: hypothetical protein LBI01_04085 [Elusimicrobium sp.]|jgi:Mg/Co/Ni transporter MgtE|nr:hypothetical protein [Elusimicrobium sp.]